MFVFLRPGFQWVVVLLIVGRLASVAAVPPEQPLWPSGTDLSAIQYEEPEAIREAKARAGAPSGGNRVFRRVTSPTYVIHQAPANLATGVGVVICPGGGYTDVWLDREGHDLGLWLAGRGVTSLVLKYRTNDEPQRGRRAYEWDAYLPAVVADGERAIAILRENASDLGLDPHKIGIAGFSAGGHLAFSVGFDGRYYSQSSVGASRPDFVGLFYPWLWQGFQSVVESSSSIPPTFIMNGGADRMTPADRCVDLYSILLKKEVSAELHVFGKGRHGFDLAEGHGESAALWKVSFVAWLQDLGMIGD